MRLPVLTSAALAATLVAAVAGPASAAAEPQKGAGSASSAGSLVSLTVAGQALEALRLQMPTSTGADGSKALVSVTPLLRGGAPVVPAVEVPAGSSKELPSQSAGVAGLLELATPSGTLSAAADPVSALAQATTGVGDLRLLGTDLLGEGTFSATSKVTDISSTGTKRLVVDGLTLPTLADLLAALGLDLTKLPVGTLLDLLDELDLLTQELLTTLTTLIEGLGLTTVDQLLGVLDGELDPTQVTQLLQTVTAPAELESTVGAVTSTLTGLTAQLPVTTSGYSKSVLDPGGLITVPDLIGPVTGGTDGGSTDGGSTDGGLLGPIVDGVTTPVTGAPVVGDLAGGLLDQLPTEIVDELTADINALLADPTNLTKLQDLITTLTTTLVDLVKDVLDTVLNGQLPLVQDLPALLDVPLLTVGKLDVTTLARTGADEVADVTGTVSGIEVLGTDVLDSVLGSSTVDLTTLLGGGGGALTQVQSLVDGTLGSVTDVLSDVTGLNLPLPEVEVLGVVEETITDVNGVRTARAGVEALSLTWALDEVKIPAAVSSIVGGVTGGLPVDLPLGGFQAAALPTDQLTALLSQPMSLTIGNLTDTSGFVPGAAVAAPGTPGTPGTAAPGTPGSVINPAPVRQLPRTGASTLLAGLALALLGGAYALRRRSEGLAVD